jgi:hypothetical protein
MKTTGFSAKTIYKLKMKIMVKKLLLICAVVVSTMCLSFTAFAPAVQNSVSGHVYDQSNPLQGVSGIQVDEIDDNSHVLSTTTTSESGYFSIQVRNSKTTLRFSDPEFNEFSTQSCSFDLSREDCSDVSVYMTLGEEW